MIFILLPPTFEMLSMFSEFLNRFLLCSRCQLFQTSFWVWNISTELRFLEMTTSFRAYPFCRWVGRGVCICVSSFHRLLFLLGPGRCIVEKQLGVVISRESPVAGGTYVDNYCVFGNNKKIVNEKLHQTNAAFKRVRN